LRRSHMISYMVYSNSCFLHSTSRFLVILTWKRRAVAIIRKKKYSSLTIPWGTFLLRTRVGACEGKAAGEVAAPAGGTNAESIISADDSHFLSSSVSGVEGDGDCLSVHTLLGTDEVAR